MTRFTWSRTFPDTHHDFNACDADGYLVGRIQRERGGPRDGQWVWAANGVQASAGTVGCDLSGVCDTRAEAIACVTEAWDRWMAMGGAPSRVR